MLVHIVRFLSSSFLKVTTHDLAYDKGGGFMRCLTLFANVDIRANKENFKSGEEYKKLVSIIDQRFSNSTLKPLHWTSEIHDLTEKLYGLKYKYELQYDAVSI